MGQSGFKNSVATADNFDFTGGGTGTPQMTLDGQLLIGNTGGNPTVATLTSTGGTLAITNGGGMINLEATGGIGGITKYVVDPIAGQTPYQTIQSAIDVATLAGIDAAVYVRPSTYTEDLTLYDGIQIVSATGLSDTDVGVTIVGKHLPPASGAIVLRGVKLESATHVFDSVAVGTTSIILSDCGIDVTNGFTFNLPNWTGTLIAFDLGSSGTNDGFINNTGGSTVFITNCTIGAGTANPMIVTGPTKLLGTVINCPLTTQTSADVLIGGGTCLYGKLTLSDASSVDMRTSSFETGAITPITFNSSSDLTLSNISVNTSNTQFIDGAGAGTVNMGEIDFIDGCSIDVSTAVNVLKTTSTALRGWNGAFVESPAITVTSDGATITCSVERAGGGDLTLINHNGFYFWDTTPAKTVTLTAGTDEFPLKNYIYLDGSTKVLTASTVGFPATGHSPIGTTLCQSVASLQTKKAYNVHAWTDHLTSDVNIGHIGHINSWIRHQSATWISGVVQTYTITPNGGAADSVILSTTSGVVLQLHDHTFPAFSAPIDYYVVNDSVTPYTVATDLNSLLTDSAGGALSGRYFSLVLWGCVSEATGDCKYYINLPSGSYGKATDVTADGSKFADFSIPAEFKGTGFLISQWNLQHSVAASGTWTSIDEVDLRGLYPGVSAGSGSAAAVEFPDNTFRIFDDLDSTKEIAFQASGITTGTTRTMVVQDADGVIAYSDVPHYGTGATTLTDHGVLLGAGTSPISATAALTDGQLLIGSTGLDPVPALLTSTGGTVTFTPTAGGLNLEAAGGGGGYSINTEILAADKTLTAGTDDNVQLLDPGGADRIITIDTAAASNGDTFLIINNDAYVDSKYLNIKEGGTVLDNLYPNSMKQFIFDGTNWKQMSIGTTITQRNISLGYLSRSSLYGVSVGTDTNSIGGGIAIGEGADGSSHGVAIGESSYGYLQAVALGDKATCGWRGVSIGAESDSGTGVLWACIAKGYKSKTARHQEEWRCADPITSPYNKYGYGQVDWRESSTDATPTEIFLADRASARFDILANSAVSMKINAVAYNSTDAVGKTWNIQVGIKRDGSSNTSLIGSVVVENVLQDGVYDTTYDTNNWDIAVTADDTNESLKIQVTGEATKTIRWNVEGSYSEVRF